MSIISYNGVILKILKVNVRREAILLGPTYLFTRWVISCQAVFNPGATAYTLPGSNGPPLASPLNKKTPAATTDEAVRHKLMQARAPLIYNIGGTIANDNVTINGGVEVLRSPGQFTDPNNPKNFITDRADANNGPIPLYCNIREVVGTKTMFVDWAVQTDVNESSLFTGQPPLILSHQYTMSHDIDEHFLTVRTIKGQAVLRSDLLTRAKTLAPGTIPNPPGTQNIPDQYRAWFFFPVPKGMKRNRIRVNTTMDGNTLEFELSDSELMWNYGTSANKANVTRIEIDHGVGVTSLPVEEIMLMGRQAMFDGIARMAQPGSTGGMLGNFFGGSLNVDMGMRWFNYKVIPHITSNLHIRVWGNKNSNFNGLSSVAFTVLSARVSDLLQNSQGSTGYKTGKDYRLTYHYHPSVKFVELVILVDFAGTNSKRLLGNLQITDLATLMPKSDDINGVLAQAPGNTNPLPPGPKNAWGTYQEHLVSQILMDQDAQVGDQSNTGTPPVMSETP